MRSRYTAFALGDAAYLLATWHPSTRPRTLTPDPDRTWVRLDVLDVVDGGPFATTGEVEFRAHYRDVSAGQRAARGDQHERSRFVREGGRWRYVEAVPR